MPGFKRRDGSGTSTRARNVPVFGSTVGLMREIAPAKRSPPSGTATIGCVLRAAIASLTIARSSARLLSGRAPRETPR